MSALCGCCCNDDHDDVICDGARTTLTTIMFAEVDHHLMKYKM